MADSPDPTADDRDEGNRPVDRSAPDAKPDANSNSNSDSDSDSEAQSASTEPGDTKPADSQLTDTDTTTAGTTHSPALIATAVALPVVLIVGVLVAAYIALRAPVERDPLALGPVPAPAADGPACQTLLPALPAEIDDYTKSTLVEPAPPATRAWQHPDGGEPVVLRCGLDRPLEFNRASSLTVVNGVQWFQVRDDLAETGTWFAVDRETYVALTIPDGSGTDSITAVSDVINANLPAREPTPGEL
ncbi:DUF3515 domain-containing protein [Nocardia halotolerans]|uniref:DUF3515 domain-containing protein n=1 Tax=Nocardia halotolerans TaxID=1755878 RepID=A0ABV8VJV4_9NOCA